MAEAALREAVELLAPAPLPADSETMLRYAEALQELAGVVAARGEAGDSLALLEQAISLLTVEATADPRQSLALMAAWGRLHQRQMKQERWEEAGLSLQRAFALRPGRPPALAAEAEGVLLLLIGGVVGRTCVLRIDASL